MLFALGDILGIVILLLPSPNPQALRVAGGLMFLLSFMVANFMLYRKHRPTTLDAQSLLLYQHRTKTSNAIRMKYVGSETAKDLVVIRSHVDPSGNSIQNTINQFFPPSDPQMLLHGGPLWNLDPGQEAYFYLVGEQETRSGIVTVTVEFTGATTGRHVKVQRVFPLANTEDWYML